jgi:SAM-dependent methyltransferase
VERGYFGRALLVPVPGEISNKHETVAEIFRALRPGGILSITDLMPDPHYLSRKAVRAWRDAAGFKEVASFGTWFAFTIKFVKQKSVSQTRVEEDP